MMSAIMSEDCTDNGTRGEVIGDQSKFIKYLNHQKIKVSGRIIGSLFI